jgi:5-methylcytosine-specific restriction protein A
MHRYEKGDHPFKVIKRAWYAIGEDGTMYPLKSIYALALGVTPRSFNTKEAVRVLEELAIPIERISGEVHQEFDRRVKLALRDHRARKARLANRTLRKPRVKFRRVAVYDRDPDVVAEALWRAKGHCEGCNREAPFRRKKDNSPYLEVHHTIQLANGGDDMPENARALCPNCHRKAHHG